jgi:hypothetical protein
MKQMNLRPVSYLAPIVAFGERRPEGRWNESALDRGDLITRLVPSA